MATVCLVLSSLPAQCCFYALDETPDVFLAHEASCRAGTNREDAPIYIETDIFIIVQDKSQQKSWGQSCGLWVRTQASLSYKT